MMNLLQRLTAPPPVLRKTTSILEAASRHGAPLRDVLNVGSKDTRVGERCVNLDLVASPGVDIVGDAHHLVDLVGEADFDTIVLSAVLQYCERPQVVVEQAQRVLRPGGWLFADVPFLQPYCPDGADLWRFTADGLRCLCRPPLEIVELTTSIPTGPAIAFTAQAAAGAGPGRLTATAMAWLVSVALWPLRYLSHEHPHTAGAFLLVARKAHGATS